MKKQQQYSAVMFYSCSDEPTAPPAVLGPVPTLLSKEEWRSSKGQEHREARVKGSSGVQLF